jgi:hypothetical protein
MPDERNATEAIVRHRNGGESFGEALRLPRRLLVPAATSAALRARVPHEAPQKPEVEG